MLQSTLRSQTCMVCCLSDPLQLSESHWNHYIWEVCSANRRGTPKMAILLLQPATVNRKGPLLLHDNTWLHIVQPTLQKLNGLGYEALPHPPYSPNLSQTYYHFFKHLNNFLQEKGFHNQEEAENAFQEFIECQSKDFYTLGINKLISLCQKCIDCNGSYFD